MKNTVELKWNGDRVVSSVEAVMENALKDSARKLLQDVLQNVPVDTGQLKESIELDVKSDVALIKATEPYAVFVEMGTSNQAPQPFMRPALDENEQSILSEIASQVKGVLR